MIIHKRNDSPQRNKAHKVAFFDIETSQQEYILEERFPIPIVRRSVPNCKDIRTRLVVKGYKQFSKFVASGEDTEATLKRISKSKTIKYISSFEFDPYFTDRSCLKSLVSVMRKLKDTKKINLIIRRVNINNETDLLYPVLYKMARLIKIGLWFPRTSGIDEQGFANIARIIAKCYSVRSLHYQFIDTMGYCSKSNSIFLAAQRRLVHLEEAKAYISLTDESESDEFSYRMNIKPLRNDKLKRKEMCIGVPTEWSLANENMQENPSPRYPRFLTKYCNLREVSFKSIKHPIDSEDVFELVEALTNLEHLQSLTLECLCCPLSEIDAIVFALGISKMVHLRNLTFKIINHGYISENCILRFVSLISKNPNLTHFNLIFRNVRKLNQNREPMEGIVEKLLMTINNIKCQYFRESLYITK